MTGPRKRHFNVRRNFARFFNRFARWLGISFAIFAIGCSTLSKKLQLNFPLPPADRPTVNEANDNSRLEAEVARLNTYAAKNAADRSSATWALFYQAKLLSTAQPDQACLRWQELIGVQEFPLRPLAQINAFSDCVDRKQSQIEFSDLIDTAVPSWLRETAIRVGLIRAGRDDEKLWKVRFTARLADFEKSQKTKLARLNEAMRLAKSGKFLTEIAAIEKKIRAVAPRYWRQPPTEKWLEVANDHRQARNFSLARTFYRRVIASRQFSFDQRMKALDGLRMTYKLEKNMPLFLQTTRRYLSFANENALQPALKSKRLSQAARNELMNKYLKAAVTLARAEWTEGNPAEAERILTTAENKLKKFIAVDESIYLRARIKEERGEYAQTIEALEQITIAKVTDRDLKAKIEWTRAWNLRKQKQFKEAAAQFAQLLVDEPNANNHSRLRYWLARSQKEAGNFSEARHNLILLTENDPGGWYGYLALRELGRSIPRLENGSPIKAAIDSIDAPLPADRRLTFEWLMAVGENELASRFLDATTASTRLTYTSAKLIELLELYRRTERYDLMIGRLFDLPPEERAKLVEAHPELAFPQPYLPLVKKSAQRASIAPEFIYAIMRQESAFNPLARSSADAFGLMQLIPEAARQVEKHAGVRLQSPDDLYDPETNIALGAEFLAKLLRRWNQNFIFTVASYNASEKAILGWVRTRFRGDPVEFIEDVPYEETRNYLKLVARNFISYSRLNSRRSLEFPVWCLDVQQLKTF